MKKKIFTLFVVCLMALNALQAQKAFTEGNLVILSVGKSGETLAASGNTVYLNEYSPTGTLVQSFALPSTGSNKLILSGTDEYCGYLNRSANEKYLTLAGFDATIGQVPDLDASDAATVNRTVAIIDAEANIDLSTKMSTSLANATSYTPRGVVSTDGNDLWVSAPTFVSKTEGEGGIFYIQKGNTSRVSDINRRNYSWTNARIFNQNGYNLLFSCHSEADQSNTVYSFLSDDDYRNSTYTEIPTAFNTDGTSYGRVESTIGGVPTNHTDFVLLDQDATVNGLDVTYIGSCETTAGSLTKIVGSGDFKFQTLYTISDNSYYYYGLTEGRVSESSVVLYATRLNTTSGNYELVKITDNSGYDGDPSGNSTIEVLATVSSGVALRGIALAPVSGKTVQTISTFGNIEKTYGDADFKLEATASSGNKVAYTVKDASVATVDANGTVHIVGAGTTEIYASVEGNDQYKPAEATIVLSVAKALQQVTDYTQLGKRSVKTGDPDFTINVTLTSGLKPYYVSEDESIATVNENTGLVHIVSEGTVKIYVIEDGNDNYKDFTESVLIDISEASEQEISNFNNLEKTVDDADFTLNATATSGGSITYTCDNSAVATISGNTVHITGKGVANITAKQAGNDTYDPVEKTVTLTVKYSQKIENYADVVKTFGDPDFYLGATATSGLKVSYSQSTDCVSFDSEDNNRVIINHAGVATITANQAGNDDYAAAEEVTFKLTVNKKPQIIEGLEDITMDYEANKILSLQGVATSKLPIVYSIDYDSIAIVSGSAVMILRTGIAHITASVGENDYYASADTTITLTVKGLAQTIENISDITITLGDADSTLEATATSGLDVTYAVADESVATISGNTLHLVGAGITTITVAQGGNSVYEAVSKSVTLTVTAPGKQDQNISNFSDISKSYGDENFNLLANASSDLDITYTVQYDTIASISGNTVTIVGAGSTTITASQAGNDTYNPVSKSITLTVNKATQDISDFTDITKRPDDADFDLTATASSGLEVSYNIADENVATVSNGTVHIIAKGTTTITASQLGNNNYEAAQPVVITLTVDFPSAVNEMEESSAAMVIYPNPVTNGELTVEYPNAGKKALIKITTITGKQVMIQNVVPNSSRVTLPVNGFISGIYFVAFSDENRQVIKKLIVR